MHSADHVPCITATGGTGAARPYLIIAIVAVAGIGHVTGRAGCAFHHGIGGVAVSIVIHIGVIGRQFTIRECEEALTDLQLHILEPTANEDEVWAQCNGTEYTRSSRRAAPWSELLHR